MKVFRLMAESVAGQQDTDSEKAQFLGIMLEAGEPLLVGVNVDKEITIKSCKRGGAQSTASANPDINAIAAHGWRTRQAAENQSEEGDIMTKSNTTTALGQLSILKREFFAGKEFSKITAFLNANTRLEGCMNVALWPAYQVLQPNVM